MSQPNRLPADAPHSFGGLALDRGRRLGFTLDGRRIDGFSGDTVLSALIANGVTGYGTLGGVPMGLGPQYGPAVRVENGPALPIERVPAANGLVLESVGRRRRRWSRRPAPTLGHILEPLNDPLWSQAIPHETREVDVLIVGGGVAGLAAAEAAAEAGRTVILAERRPWLGGDARYFGTVADEESPEIVSERLAALVATAPGVTIHTGAETFLLQGTSARLHLVTTGGDGRPAERIIAVKARHVVLAPGMQQRLPIFPGNRLPAVLGSIDAYHLAKRYGVTLGPSAVVATQGNHAYRLAVRLADAGVEVRRAVDTRIGPQSRFIDFAMATGITLASGQYPLAAAPGRYDFAHTGSTTPSNSYEAAQLILAGGWQPDLTLWMLAGGRTRWSVTRSALVPVGSIEGIALAGAAAGYRSLRACLESGRAVVRRFVGESIEPIVDIEAGTEFETPDAGTPVAPAAQAMPSFYAGGASLASRPPTARAAALSVGDVAASVELGLIAPGDAGAVAEERGVPGDDIVASGWKPTVGGNDDWLVGRFGDDPVRVHLVVDATRSFEIGALLYANGTRPDPQHAAGVIIEEATPGGIALVSRETLAGTDRFVVETLTGPSPARVKR